MAEQIQQHQQQEINHQLIQQPPLLQEIVTNLFKNFLQDEQQQTTKIISFSHNTLLQLLSQCSTFFYKSIQKKHKRVLTFLANYHKIIQLYALKQQSHMTNNITLHFINLLAYSRMKQNNIDEARNIYKNIWTYVGINKSTDKLLLSIGLNNLGYLHLKNNKYFKSLECHLKVVQLMSQHLRQVKTMKQNNKSYSNKIIQDSVILISNLINCQKTLKFILSSNQDYISINHQRQRQMQRQRQRQMQRQRQRQRDDKKKKSTSSTLLKNSFYYELFQYINQIGYKCSKKYLGEKSQFTKVFLTNLSQHNNNKQLLPVFYEQQQQQQQSVQRTTLQQKILSQLEGIYQVLKTKRQQQREIIYVRQQQQKKPAQQQNIVIPQKNQQTQNINKQQSITQHIGEQNILSNQQQMQQGSRYSRVINGWSVMLYFLRPKHIYQSKQNKKFQQQQQQQIQLTLGTLVIECKKSKRLTKTIISTERLKKILTLIIDRQIYQFVQQSNNLQSFLQKNRISGDEQFFNHIIFPHMFISDDGNSDGIIQISPRKISLIQKPFSLTFLQQQSLIFLYHKYRNNFDINISPINSSFNLSLHVEFNQRTINQLFTINEKHPKYIVDTYQQIRLKYYKRQIQMPQLVKCYQKEELLLTQVTLIDQNQVKDIIVNIVRDFQSFILDIEQQDKGNLKLSDYLSMIENDQLNKISYFSFTETYLHQHQLQASQNNKLTINSPTTKNIKGKFSSCKYLQNISSIQIYCQNNYQTFDIESQSQAKGTVMIYPDKFQKQFGISIKTIEKQGMIISLLQMLNKRYQLRVFYSHLKTHDQQLYNQNAIYELPLTCKSYKRSIIKSQDNFMIPITISLLTLNSNIPVSFRIDAYFPCQGCCGQYSILMKVKDCLWVKPSIIQQDSSKQQQGDNNNNNKEAIQNQEEDYETKLVINNKQNKQSQGANVYKKDYFLAQWCELQGYNMLLKHIRIQDMKIKFKRSIFRYFSFQRVLESIMKNQSQ